jgi:hypothetical protein
MDKKIAGLLGAVAALSTANAAQASPAPPPVQTEVLKANSYANLLEPIPNAAAILRAVDEGGPELAAAGEFQVAAHGCQNRPVAAGHRSRKRLVSG